MRMVAAMIAAAAGGLIVWWLGGRGRGGDYVSDATLEAIALAESETDKLPEPIGRRGPRRRDHDAMSRYDKEVGR